MTAPNSTEEGIDVGNDDNIGIEEVAQATLELQAAMLEREHAAARAHVESFRPPDVHVHGVRTQPSSGFLGRDDSLERWVADRGANGGASVADEFSLGRALAAMVTGDRRSLTDMETRALAEGTDSAGGFLVPEPLAGRVIDLLRPQTQVLSAGAVIVPMGADQLSIARLTGGNTATWRAENTAVPESDQTFDRVTFHAKTCAILMRLSMELFEDLSDVSFGTITSEIVQRLGLALDHATLRGSGTGSEPTGIRNQTGINTVSLGAAGSTPTSYGFLIDAIASVRDENGTPNAAIYSSRTQTTLDKLVDTTGQPLRQPESVAALSKYTTNQIPNDLTVGASTNCSEAYVADWSTVMIGLRPSVGVRVKVLDQKYADQMQIGVLAWLRADVQLAHPELATVVTGIRP